MNYLTSRNNLLSSIIAEEGRQGLLVEFMTLVSQSRMSLWNVLNFHAEFI